MDDAGLHELVQTYIAARDNRGTIKIMDVTKRCSGSTDIIGIGRLAAVFGYDDDEAQAVASFTALQP